MPRTSARRTLRLYQPHDVQRALHESKARYRIGVWGRQSGKSTWGNQELIKKAWVNRNHTYWFVAPTFDQAKIQYRRAVGALWPCRQVMTKKNQSELRIKLCTGSQIVYKSGDRPDNLRSETLNGVIIDECRDQDPNLWTMVISSMLRTTHGWAAFTGTPNGFDWLFDLTEECKKLKDPSLMEFFRAPAWCSPLWTPAEVDDARRLMSAQQFRQEVEAEFVELYNGQVYVTYGDENQRDTAPWTTNAAGVNPYLPIVVALDFNLSPMCWTLGQTNGHGLYWFDEIHVERTHTAECAHELVDRIKKVHALIPGPKPTVVLVGDATGKAGQRAAAGKSDYDILCEVLTTAGIRWENRTPESNPMVRDRVNNVNAKLKSASGHVSMWHHSRCVKLRKDFLRVAWKKGSCIALDNTKDAMLTHQSDGVGYAVSLLCPIPSNLQVGGLTVINR